MFGIVGKTAYAIDGKIKLLGSVSDYIEDATTGTVVLNVSSLGLAQNDIIIVSVGFTDGQRETDIGVTISGYTKIVDISASDTRDAHLEIFYKFMGASPDSTISVQVSERIDSFMVATATAWRNVDTSSPFDVTTQTATGGNTNYANPPSITPVTIGTYILGIVTATAAETLADFSNFPVLINPAGVTATGGLTATAVGQLPAIHRQVYYDEWSSGAYDMGNFTVTPTSTSDSWAAATIALRQKQ